MAITRVLDIQTVVQVMEAACLRTPCDYMDYCVNATAASAPVFDKAHPVYATSHIDTAFQSTTGDNSGGTQDPLHLEPMLTYSYTTGFSTQRETAARTPAFRQPRRRRQHHTLDPEPIVAAASPVGRPERGANSPDET